jgi:protein-S-isoprenylcysteine O-methyltransferase Ste14
MRRNSARGTAEMLELGVRWLTALAWLVPVGLAVQGAWRGRQARGRQVGRPFGHLPWWLYGLLSSAEPILLVVGWRPLPLALSRLLRLASTVSGGVFSALGIGLVVWGRLALGAMHNVSSAFGVRLYAGHRLVTTGPYALVRHPMYLGAFMGVLGAVLVYRTWTMVVVLAQSAVFEARASREDEALAAEFGETWQSYKRRVPAWIPRPRSVAQQGFAGSAGRWSACRWWSCWLWPGVSDGWPANLGR